MQQAASLVFVTLESAVIKGFSPLLSEGGFSMESTNPIQILNTLAKTRV